MIRCAFLLFAMMTAAVPAEDEPKLPDSVNPDMGEPVPGTPDVYDCSSVKDGGFTTSGVYRIYVDYNMRRHYANAFCDLTTTSGVWTVFQRRKDGSEDFNRGWDDYAKGFGNPNGEFWLGNEILHLLTSKREYRLRIDLEDWEGNKRYAEYSVFNLAPYSDNYRLTLGTYTGDAGDSFSYHSGQEFSTKDSDNDHATANAIHGDSCAISLKAGYWFNDCHNSNLNGIYYQGGSYSVDDFNGIDWYYWGGWHSSLKTTEMKISPLI